MAACCASRFIETVSSRRPRSHHWMEGGNRVREAGAKRVANILRLLLGGRSSSNGCRHHVRPLAAVGGKCLELGDLEAANSGLVDSHLPPLLQFLRLQSLFAAHGSEVDVDSVSQASVVCTGKPKRRVKWRRKQEDEEQLE